MVRFWPFGGRDDNSPDSFERILSKLASRIQSCSSKLALLRQHSRRYKALFTFYSVIGYIIYGIVVVLVIGYQNVGVKEGGSLVGIPLGIYGIRKLLDLYYGRRIASTEATLEDLQRQQRDTIEKLKTATKFSTTQSIIERYSGTSTGASVPVQQAPKQIPTTKAPAVGTTAYALRSRQPPQQQQASVPVSVQTPEQLRVQQLLAQQAVLPTPCGGTPPVQQRTSSHPLPPKIEQRTTPALQIQGHTQPPSQQHLQPEEATVPKWYDRILDVVLGEDETSARNRFALICKNCRMVNGLAPPGTRSLNGMDPWGCARCGTMNGGEKKSVVEAIEDEPVEVKQEILDEPTETVELLQSVPRITRSRSKCEGPAATGVESETDAGGGDDGSLLNIKTEEQETQKPKQKSKSKGKRKA